MRRRMPRGAAVLVLLLALSLGGTGCESWRLSRPPPGRDVHVTIPSYQYFTLPSGLTVIVKEHRHLPRVAIALSIRIGTAAEPPERPGLFQLALGLLVRGNHALDRALDPLGTSLQWSADEEGTLLSFSVAPEDVKPALMALARHIQIPPLDLGTLGRERERDAASLAAEKADPRSLAVLALMRSIYGAEHPMVKNRMRTPVDLEKIGVEDLTHFYQSFLGPRNVALVVSGNLSAAEVQELVRDAFGGWDRKVLEAPAMPPPSPSPRSRVVLVPKSTVVGAALAVGGVGVPRGHADEHPLRLAIAILSGRLSAQLREERGVTYGISTSVVNGQRGGHFLLRTQVRGSATEDSLEEIISQALGTQYAPASWRNLPLIRANEMLWLTRDFGSLHGDAMGGRGSS